MFFGLWLVAYLTYRFTLQITDIHGSCFSRPCWTMEYTLVFPPPPWLLNILFISPLLVEILQFNFPVRLQCLALGLSSPPMCIPRHALSGVEASSYKLHLSAVGDISRLQTGVLLPVPTLFSHQTVLHYPKVANLHQVLLGLLDQGVIIPVLVVKLFRGFTSQRVYCSYTQQHSLHLGSQGLDLFEFRNSAWNPSYLSIAFINRTLWLLRTLWTCTTEVQSIYHFTMTIIKLKTVVAPSH